MDKLEQSIRPNSLASQLKSALFSRRLQRPESTVAQPIQEQKDTTSAQDIEKKYLERQASRVLEINALKQEIAADKTYVNQVIKNKLAEYNVAENTQVKIRKGALGNIEIDAPILPSQSESIARDLSKDKHFAVAFNRLTKTEPTLSYVDNVTKINQAYGVKNTLLDSLISENKDFNHLKDISLRYESLKSAQGFANSDTAQSAFSLTVA